jgi:hypothetical protein
VYGIKTLGLGLAHVQHFHGYDIQTVLFKHFDNFTDKTALDPIGFNNRK